MIVVCVTIRTLLLFRLAGNIPSQEAHRLRMVLCSSPTCLCLWITFLLLTIVKHCTAVCQCEWQRCRCVQARRHTHRSCGSHQGCWRSCFAVCSTHRWQSDRHGSLNVTYVVAPPATPAPASDTLKPTPPTETVETAVRDAKISWLLKSSFFVCFPHLKHTGAKVPT